MADKKKGNATDRLFAKMRKDSRGSATQARIDKLKKRASRGSATKRLVAKQKKAQKGR
jgi:hypothetical protein